MPRTWGLAVGQSTASLIGGTEAHELVDETDELVRGRWIHAGYHLIDLDDLPEQISAHRRRGQLLLRKRTIRVGAANRTSMSKLSPHTQPRHTFRNAVSLQSPSPDVCLDSWESPHLAVPGTGKPRAGFLRSFGRRLVPHFAVPETGKPRASERVVRSQLITEGFDRIAAFDPFVALTGFVIDHEAAEMDALSIIWDYSEGTLTALDHVLIPLALSAYVFPHWAAT